MPDIPFLLVFIFKISMYMPLLWHEHEILFRPFVSGCIWFQHLNKSFFNYTFFASDGSLRFI